MYEWEGSWLDILGWGQGSIYEISYHIWSHLSALQTSSDSVSIVCCLPSPNLPRKRGPWSTSRKLILDTPLGVAGTPGPTRFYKVHLVCLVHVAQVALLLACPPPTKVSQPHWPAIVLSLLLCKLDTFFITFSCVCMICYCSLYCYCLCAIIATTITSIFWEKCEGQ